MEAFSKHSIRYALARNLSFPLDSSIDGFGLRLELEAHQDFHLESETSWGSREATWLVGEGAMSSFPAQISIVLVKRSKRKGAFEDEIVSECANSTLAHPMRVGSNSGQPNGLVIFRETIDRLIPLPNATTKDLVHACLPPNTLLFSTEHFGRLYASHSTVVKILQGWGRELPIALLTSDEDGGGIVRRMASTLGKSGLDELSSLAERIVQARANISDVKQRLSLQLQERIAVAEAARSVLLVRSRKRELEARQEAVLTVLQNSKGKLERTENALMRQSNLFKSSVDYLSLAQDGTFMTRLKSESQLLQKVLQLVMGRRLFMAAGVLRVYPLSSQLLSCVIRDANLDSSDEEDRATALGFLAHLVSVLGVIFDITLRYSTCCFGSRSFVIDDAFFLPIMDSQQRFDSLSNASALASSSGLFPLFSVGVERGAKQKCEMGVTLLLNSVRQVTEVLKSRMTTRIEEVPNVSFNNNGKALVSPLVETLARFKLVLAELRVMPPLELRVVSSS